MKRWRSCAQWDRSVRGFYANNVTKDDHETYEQAFAVTLMLERQGLGGEGIHFPLKTWVEPIEEKT